MKVTLSSYDCLVLSVISQKYNIHLNPLDFTFIKDSFQVSEILRHNWPSHVKKFMSKLLSQLKTNQAAKLQSSTDDIVNETQALARSCYKNNYWMCPWTSDDYPPLLRFIVKSPWVLYGLGNRERLLDRGIHSIIGTRRACPESLSSAFETGRELANQSVTIINGGAYGCDISALRGVMQSYQAERTINVQACGLDHAGPVFNRNHFRDAIQRGGVMISERLFHQRAEKFHFPIRNRIVAGMSHGVVVMQAAQKSGTLITARFAAENGRYVYVYDHEKTKPVNQGGLDLIEQGAQSFDKITNLLR